MNLRQFFVGRTIGFLILLIVIGLVAAFYAFNNYIYEQKQATAADDVKDAEYSIDGQHVKLVDGVAETEAAPGSASKITTKYFGNEVTTDLDGDGRADKVFILTQSGGGTGTFYYVVAALNTERGYVGSEALYLGDRIAPQTTEVSQNPSHKGVIVVNYADRAAGEPMAATPSVGKSIWLKLDVPSMQFGEVAQNFEGEANSSSMTLGMKEWEWVNAEYYGYARPVEFAPKQPGVFMLTFEESGMFFATTDCNSISGSYIAGGGMIEFKNVASTKMYCEGSQGIKPRLKKQIPISSKK